MVASIAGLLGIHLFERVKSGSVLSVSGSIMLVNNLVNLVQKNLVKKSGWKKSGSKKSG